MASTIKSTTRLLSGMAKQLGKMEKQALRKHTREALSRMTSEQITEQSLLVTKHALELKCLEATKCASIFLSRPTLEVQTETLCKELGKRGIQVFVPHMTAGSKDIHMEMIELYPGEDVSLFPKDKWGIPVVPEPDNRRRAKPSELDIIFAPGVAFDLFGRRLGNGKGYYDNFFTSFDNERIAQRLSKVLKYSLALEPMLVLAVPVDAHDVILDGIITPNGTVTSIPSPDL